MYFEPIFSYNLFIVTVKNVIFLFNLSSTYQVIRLFVHVFDSFYIYIAFIIHTFVHSFVFIRSFVSSFICRFSLLIYLSVTSRDRLPWNVSLLYDISVHPEQNQFPENDESSKSEFISSSWSISNREWKIQNVYDGIHVFRFRPSSNDNDNAVCKATVSFLICTLN